MDPDGSTTDLGGQAGTTLATTVYERLRADIVSGQMLPGDKLRLEPLRARYEVGATPLREALNRLAAERLVAFADQKGFRVAAVSQEDLNELTRTRRWLEGIALREAIGNGDAQWEEQVLLAFHRLSREPRSADEDFHVSTAAWEVRHRDFHRSLIAACGSRWLLLFCEQLHDQASRYRNLAQAISYPQRDALAEHEAIMRASIDRRADEAISLLETHYARTTGLILDADPTVLDRA